MAAPSPRCQTSWQICRRLLQHSSPSKRSFSVSGPSCSNGSRQTSRFAKPVDPQVPPNTANRIQPKQNVVLEPPATPSAVSRPSAVRRPGPAATATESKKVDINSKEYKRVARKVTSLMVALPFLIVTSYYLWDRLAPGGPSSPSSDDAPPTTPLESKST
ncbi:hypothetical protein QBC40DRAFT_22756 [Triangularia verruculosa]|uniref:Uncharacterized protein n=1 Tax=Triangularia verruculosa TaxID=2587418 RepID=A0AAN6X702_9PEZI|nr:hypothetical protein QBC40DRAFT_22756 [Triangularia verruculosa]